MPRTKEAFETMREHTKKKIETTALALFARNGLSVKIDEIAKAAGISKGLLYNHFPSKEELIAALARAATEISGQSIQTLAQSPDSAANKVKMISSTMNDMLLTQPVGINNFMFMIQVGMSGFKLPPEATYCAATPNPIKSLAEIIKQGQREETVVDGDATQLAIAYWGAIQGICCYVATGMTIATKPEMFNRILLKEALV